MSALIEKDFNTIWHPCSQMKDYETFKPLEIEKAQGSYLHLKNGKKVLDAISSWWCKSLGHQHPRLKQAIKNQMEKFEHVIFPNTTNDVIVELSEKLINLTSSLSKVFYAGDGSCAVEIAMKMSLHSRVNQGDHKRNQFIALENGYHGETVGALSVSDIGIYKTPYESILFHTHFISNLPYVNDVNASEWHDCETHWKKIEKQLQPLSECATAIVLEPIVQGAGGMKIYSQDFLKRLCAWAKQHNIHVIADEIMTGIGRTGKWLAVQHAGIEPDFLCLSKGLTAGWLPFSAVLTSQAIYDVFYDDYESGKSFLHSHTYSGNVLAASVACQVLKIIEEENMIARANHIGRIMRANMDEVAIQTSKIKNVRNIGAIVAADLVENSPSRYGYYLFQRAVELGVLLRPLGNTIYWMPPLNIEEQDLFFLKEITTKILIENFSPNRYKSSPKL
jgi:adenosylmethionine-8-amino-7-oxononanoate aminotransferase